MRLDLEIIADLIIPNSQVLDVGCGDGTLLSYLKDKKNIFGKGIEIDNKKVAVALKKGLSIIQGDADNDLINYPSNAADYVILSQTLQATKEPALILEELKRIAKYCIISVPNFGYWENRLSFALKGRMPVTQTLSYNWYNTPNIHFCTIKDFIILCHELNFVIEKQFFINETSKLFKNSQYSAIGNIFSKYGIFLLKRGVTVDSNISKPSHLKNLSLTGNKNFARSSNLK